MQYETIHAKVSNKEDEKKTEQNTSKQSLKDFLQNKSQHDLNASQNWMNS